MKTMKIIGGSVGAIILLVISQILSQLAGSLFVSMKLATGIGNIVVGIACLIIVFFLLKVFAERVLRTKITGGSLGVIILFVISQILSQLAGSPFVSIKLATGLGNIVAGIAYLFIAFFSLKVFAERVLKIEITKLGMPKFHIDGKWIAVAIALPVVIMAIYLLTPGKFVSSNMNADQIFSTLSAGIVFTGVAAGFVEEIVFRGFVLNLLKEKYNTWVAVLAPSALFGIVHIIGTNYSFLSCCLVICAGIMVGIMFSVIEMENNSVWNSGVVHAVWNMIIIGGGLTISNAPDQHAIMTYALDNENFAITGGEFGIEASAIALLGYGIVTLLVVRIIKKKRSIS